MTGKSGPATRGPSSAPKWGVPAGWTNPTPPDRLDMQARAINHLPLAFQAAQMFDGDDEHPYGRDS